MKTILYNPIFINPQAYYVFPRLTRYLQPDNESTAEPANYIGTIEVKVIAYGDTTLKRTYTNTDSIDLSEFKNTWIRISLFTKVGSCVLGEWKIGNMESDLPYIDPEVLASLKAVVIVGNKTNNDSDRAIVKNLVDPDNPFVISNAAYTEGSGYADKDSPYYGAFVTDGVNDLITSTKTVQEMGITDEVTVVSMIHQIDLNSTYTIATTNYIENSNSREHVRSDVYNYGKTGIYGYSASLINNTKSDIKNILGDEADYYVKSTNSLQTIFDAKFSVVGRISELTEASQVAWYWTIIANKVLTTDQINQVIAYFNLDKTLKPDILCNTIKQGITNENHAEFGDKLIDFSGNGRDIQLNNIAWDGDSGIGKYNYPNWKVNVTQGNKYARIVYYDSINGTYSADFKGITDLYKSYGLSIEIRVNRANTIDYHSIKEDGIYTMTPPDDTTSIDIRFGGENVYNASCDITITQIPSHAGALCLDGVNDFGQFVGDLGLKDYTLIMNRAYNNLINNQVPLVSSNIVEDQTPFIVEHWNTGSNAISFSYGASRTTDIPLDINKKIVYQSTYSYMGYVIPKGNAISTGGGITLGKFGNGVQYSAICLWSLMLFPYSMSEFLIERQLKKHKLGTLYPDMVEFRPIVKSNVKYSIIEIWQRDKSLYNSAVNDDKTGIYLKKDSTIVIYVKPYVGQKVSEIVYNGVSYTDLKLNSNRFYYKVVPITKSPQKIDITIEQDENYVQWNPVVESNAEYSDIAYLNYSHNIATINVGDYINVGDTVGIRVILNSTIDEVVNCKVNGQECEIVNVSPRVFDCKFTLTSESPQKINITIDEYIRYEDIVQPYPLFFEFTDENNNLISWGGKAKVGSTITRTKGVNYANLLEGLFTITNPRLNGVALASAKHIVEKSMVFTCTATYTFDNNEPKCILSPRLLRIPNSSYKILGYIPDISGHNNNGIIHNSAYAEGSGVNEDGSYQFDGVDDFVAIPTLSSGGKQVLMKANWQSNIGDAILYDQRFNVYNYEFAIYNSNTDNYSENPHAYSSRNNGKTYIDGILNTYIKSAELQNVTHNIIATNELSSGSIPLSPIIGSNISHDSAFAQMSLYDFMLFDEISTDDKIKELNEYVGIEAKVELPPYYWDTYGKTNLDADKATIQQRGVAVGDYDLTNYNHAYEGMSGYNGYPIILSGTNRTYQNKASYVNVVGDDKNVINLTRISFNTAAIFSYVKQNGELTSYSKDIESFKIKVTGIDYSRFVIKYSYISEANATAKTTMTIASDSIYELPKSFASDGSLTSSDVWIGINFTKQSNDIPDIIEDVNVTIEVLPEYENGLVYDGITDYSKNANIPALDDFTAIIKREWLKKQGCPLIKGSKVYEGGNGNALLLEWDKAYNFVFYKRTDIMEGELPDNISFITPTNYNGNVITRGSEQDTNGICIAGDGNAGFANMVFYKLILYPKTIPLLQINFLKNLMERDEIIDLNNKIFIQE